MLSAFCRNGCMAAAASGNVGAQALSGPISRMTRFMMPRAGRPVKMLVIAVVEASALFNVSRCTALVVASGHDKYAVPT